MQDAFSIGKCDFYMKNCNIFMSKSDSCLKSYIIHSRAPWKRNQQPRIRLGCKFRRYAAAARTSCELRGLRPLGRSAAATGCRPVPLKPDQLQNATFSRL